MRWDTHGWGSYGPAVMVDIRAGVDANGNLTAFEFTDFGIPYFSTQPSEHQVTGNATFSTAGPVETTISGEQYNIPNRRVIGKSLPLQNNYLKSIQLRAPRGPQTAFAAEQAVDELAYMAKMDPVAFRLQNIAVSATTDPALRWRNVLTAAAKDTNWQARVAASNLSSANVVTGRGIAFGFYSSTMTCCVADVEVNKSTGKIVAKELHIAGDAGLIVYPAGSENNEEGAAMQGLSRAVRSGRVRQEGRHEHRLGHLSDGPVQGRPDDHIHGLTRTDVPDPAGAGSRTTGSGEPAMSPVPAAIANAFFDATGVRIRESPMTPSRVRAVLAAAGK